MNQNYTLAKILLMCLVSASLFSQNFNYISDYDSQGVPIDMVNTSVSQSLLDNIDASFPEGYPVPEYNPEYIADDVETNVILTELADVWVTFVGEGAGYKNVLGYYTYDVFDPPTSPPSDQDVTIIFPNVSAAGSGGGLIIGDKMYLGQFPANTGIGWVLIANGWNGNQVTYGNWMLYSNPFFNPEGSQELQKHNVNLYDDNELVVVFGFEDIRRDFSSCDQDFNDALFLVTSNPYNAMQTGNFNPISTDGGGQSSGNDGGLESHRGISSSIAKRTYNRNSKSNKILPSLSKARSNNLLSNLVPTSIKSGDQRSISSPIDLEDITSAEVVWSADYNLDDNRFATVFATQTENQIYDHTKVVCDRLAGSEIIGVREISIDNETYLLTSLQNSNNSIEYSISFSIETTPDQNYRVFSRWAVDQYTFGNTFLNYQIWTSAPFMTIDIVKKIINNIQETHGRIEQPIPLSYLPDVYVKKGKYTNNVIELVIYNSTNQNNTITLVGSMTESEVDQNLELYSETIIVPPGEHIHNIEFLDRDIFDLEIKVRKMGSTQYDVAYFSDGAWGLDYDDKNTIINDIAITKSDKQNPEEYSVARNISVDLESEDYVSIYRHLKPSGGTVNLEKYNTLEFDAVITKPTEIKLIKHGISNWKEQFSYVINPSEESTTFKIPFSYFKNGSDQELRPNDIKMVVFTQQENTGMDNNIEISNVSFLSSEDSEIEIDSGLSVFPSPTNGNITATFESFQSSTGSINILNSQGKLLYSEIIAINKGLNIIRRNLSKLENGVLLIQIESTDGVTYSEKVVKL